MLIIWSSSLLRWCFFSPVKPFIFQLSLFIPRVLFVANPGSISFCLLMNFGHLCSSLFVFQNWDLCPDWDLWIYVNESMVANAHSIYKYDISYLRLRVRFCRWQSRRSSIHLYCLPYKCVSWFECEYLVHYPGYCSQLCSSFSNYKHAYAIIWLIRFLSTVEHYFLLLRTVI